MVTDFMFGIIKPLVFWIFVVGILNMAIIPIVFVDGVVTETTALGAGVLAVINVGLMLPFLILLWRGAPRRFPRRA